MEFFNAGHHCEVCDKSHPAREEASECFTGHGFEQIGGYLHFRLCPCGWRNKCDLHNAENGNPEGHRMYWTREATVCELVAQQNQITLREAVFLYISARVCP